jgi:alpha-N-arabinofuranosidase
VSRKLLAALSLLGGIASCIALGSSRKHASPQPESLTTALIEVHPGDQLGPISNLIYGVGLEWTENGNRILDPKSGELRADMVSRLAPLRIPVWRFPGGILADYYDWRDGIGPRDRRPKRRSPMDNSEQENSFGTDEFIGLCRALGSEALITANFGTGSLQATLGWRDYFRQKGFPVRYWEIGNEIYLAEPRQRASIPGNDSRIYKTARDYISGYQEWSKALREGAPGTLIGAIAGTYNTSPQNKDWLRTLAESAAADIDFVSLHDSFAPLILSRYDYADPLKRKAAYRAMYAQTLQTAEDIRNVQREFKQRGGRDVKIAVTEHFPLFGGGGSQSQMLMILDQSRTMASAVYTASLLQTYIREGVLMSNYNIATSKWFGALLTDTEQGLVRTPTWHVYDLYRNHFGDRQVWAKVTSPEYATEKLGAVQSRTGVPFLDVTASLDSEKAVYLAVVNRHESQAIAATLNVAGAQGPVEVWTIAGPSPNAINGQGLSRSTESGPEDNIVGLKSMYSGTGTYAFPPTSVTIMKWPRLMHTK